MSLIAPPGIENIIGFMALLCYIFTLSPTITRTVIPRYRLNPLLVFFSKNRRNFGIATWVFGLIHGILITIQRDLNFFEISTIIAYFQGISLLTIFTVLAVTSNDLSVKILKKNWKKIHRLTYVAMFVLLWHILDKMNPQWSFLTPLGLLLISGTIIFFVMRLLIERKRKKKSEILKIN